MNAECIKRYMRSQDIMKVSQWGIISSHGCLPSGFSLRGFFTSINLGSDVKNDPTLHPHLPYQCLSVKHFSSNFGFNNRLFRFFFHQRLLLNDSKELPSLKLSNIAPENRPFHAPTGKDWDLPLPSNFQG